MEGKEEGNKEVQGEREGQSHMVGTSCSHSNGRKHTCTCMYM